MLAAVATELVGAREAFPAALVVTHVRLLPRVLPDVHLEVGELQVALGAARVEADKWFPLFFSLGHDCLSTDELRWLGHLLSDLRDDEGRLGRHGHVDGAGSVVLVRIGWDAVGHYLDRQCRGLGVVLHVGRVLHEDRVLVDW